MITKPRREVSNDEIKLNKLFLACFRSGSGKAVLNYLKQISIYSVSGPGVAPDSLMHLEGQRFIVAEIERRIALGRNSGDE